MASSNQDNKQGGNKGSNQSGSNQSGGNQGGSKQSDTSNRGFASMDPEQQRDIAAEGGRAAHASGHAHEFTPEEARKAGSMSHKNDGNQQSGSGGSGSRGGTGGGAAGNQSGSGSQGSGSGKSGSKE